MPKLRHLHFARVHIHSLVTLETPVLVVAEGDAVDLSIADMHSVCCTSSTQQHSRRVGHVMQPTGSW